MSAPDPRLAEVLRLAPVQGQSVRALSRGLPTSRRAVRRPHTPREASVPLDFPPGAAVQVDWAAFGFALPGCPRRVSAFVMALCYSRYLYVEFTVSQSIAALLRCMENGLRFYGGSTVVDIFDNMKTVVLEHSPRPTVFNPPFMEYAHSRAFLTLPCTS